VIALATLAVVASAVASDGETAVALDDGTVWLVHDGAWEELGGCDDGVVALASAGDDLLIECADGSAWTWNDATGWAPRADQRPLGAAGSDLRSWWPVLELSVRTWRPPGEPRPAVETWVWLRWNL
jgi:hypothetical protein